MRKVVMASVLLFTSYAFAETGRPGFLVLRQNEKMLLVGPPQQTSFEVACPQAVFDWEGRSSTARFAIGDEGLNIEFKLDIVGPDWLYVNLNEGEEGLLLTLRRTNSDGTISNQIDARSYPDYGGLLKDPNYSAFISTLMRRCGQNPLLPDIDVLRTTLFGVTPSPDESIDQTCEKLIAQLDDPRWRVRDAAARQLSEASMAPHALCVARGMELTAEQRSRIDAIANLYLVDIPADLVGPLVAIEFPNGDVAVASN
jgi:hypothetical protein